jgi:hypothetical protein
MDKKAKIDSIDEVNRFLDRLEKDDHVILCPVLVSKDKETSCFAVESERQNAGYLYLLQETWRRKIPTFIEFEGEKIPIRGKQLMFLSAADAQKVVQNPASLQEEWVQFPIHLSEKMEIEHGSLTMITNVKDVAERVKKAKLALDKIGETTGSGIFTNVVVAVHLIFDSFPNKKAAEGFASIIRERYGRMTTVHETRRDADDYLSSRHDAFPFGLFPPIVIVERDPQWAEKEGEMEREREMRNLADEFAGTFAGT